MNKIRLSNLNEVVGKMNSKLTEKVNELANNNEVEALNKLLCEWPEKTAEWFLYLSMRISAPSTSSEQLQELKRVRDKAIASNPELLEDEYFNGDAIAQETDVSDAETTNVSSENKSEAKEEFKFSEQEQMYSQIIETLEEFDECELEEIDTYLGTLDYANLGYALQHLVNQYVYAFLTWEGSTPMSDVISKAPEYQAWAAIFTPESILNNPNFSIDDVLRYGFLRSQIGLIKSKGYYAYLVASGDEDLKGFEHHQNQFSSTSSSSSSTSASDVEKKEEIEKFEKKYAVKFPAQLTALHQHEQEFDISSLSSLEYHLSDERLEYEHRKGMGIIDAIRFIWSNDKSDFTVEGGVFTQAQIDSLNQQYTFVRTFTVDEETYVILYFDENGHFGAVWYNQDAVRLFDHYLDLMLEQSLAQHSLYQLLVTLPMIIDNPLFDDEDKEELIRDLRKL